MYSQNNEEAILLEYFNEKTGTLVSLGENDGETLSNVRQLILNGWSGILVEPSLTAFGKLQKLYAENEKIECFNIAIANTEGNMEFYESGTHLQKGDTSLLSTLKKTELARWKRRGEKFSKTRAEVKNWNSLMSLSKFKTFDLISIDCEGMDIEILRQIDLSETQLICIEWNLKDEDLHDIKKYCEKFGLNKTVLLNSENVILGR